MTTKRQVWQAMQGDETLEALVRMAGSLNYARVERDGQTVEWGEEWDNRSRKRNGQLARRVYDDG